MISMIMGTMSPIVRYRLGRWTARTSARIVLASRLPPVCNRRPQGSISADSPVLAQTKDVFLISTDRKTLQAKWRSRQLVPKNHPSLVMLIRTSGSCPCWASVLTCHLMKCGTVDSKQILGLRFISFFVITTGSVPGFIPPPIGDNFLMIGNQFDSGTYSPNMTR